MWSTSFSAYLTYMQIRPGGRRLASGCDWLAGAPGTSAAAALHKQRRPAGTSFSADLTRMQIRPGARRLASGGYWLAEGNPPTGTRLAASDLTGSPRREATWLRMGGATQSEGRGVQASFSCYGWFCVTPLLAVCGRGGGGPRPAGLLKTRC